MSLFPSLEGFEPTRKTLHLYANAIGVVPRTHATPHDKWWHASLRVTSKGLKTAVFDLPNGETAWLEMDLTQHVVRLQTSYGGMQVFDMQARLTGTEFGDEVVTAVAKLGLSGEYARAKFENNEPRIYDPEQATNFFTVLTHAHQVFNAHRATLIGQLGPIQLWPHGFDLSFEWFGTRVESHVENGELVDNENAAERLHKFAQGVYELAAPTLMAA